MILVTIYCLLFVPTKVFLEELIMLLEISSASSEIFVLAGDVNIHLDDKDDTYTKQFNDILEMFNHKQHVNFATHRLGHTIDVVVTHTESPIIENIKPNNVDLSDHYIVQFEVKSIAPNKIEYINVKYRDVKSVNNERFCADIKQCCDSIHSNDLQEKVGSFNTLTRKVVDSHAPQKTKQVKIVPSAPCFNTEYKTARQCRRKAEKKYKQSGLVKHKAEFVNIRQQTTALAFTKKRDYFAEKIVECNGNSKTLFNCLKLLDDKRETVLPSHDTPLELAERFKLYFRDKICNIRKSFVNINN